MECPPRRAKPHTMFSAKCACTSRKSPSSITRVITFFMSYGLFGLSGTIVERGVLAVDRSARAAGWRLEVVLRQERKEVTRILEARLLVWRREVGNPGLGRMGRGAPELLKRHLLARHGLHDVGPGDEHVGRPLDHEHEVRIAGEINSPTGTGPRRRGICGTTPEAWTLRQKISAYPATTTLLDPRAAGTNLDPDDRTAVLHGESP